MSAHDEPSADSMRIQKYLSRAGACSRRKAERLMRAGRVAVNGEVVTEMGSQVTPGVDRVELDGELVELDLDTTYIALYKTRGVITSLDDPRGRPVVTDLLPDATPRVWPVGRLDWDSEGLLLLTNDGDLTHLLTHPGAGVEKTYRVKLTGTLHNDDAGLARMREGLVLDDGFKTAPADVWVARTTEKNTWVEVVLHEGHNRQIRKMADAVGHRVVRLKRVAVGPVTVDGLKPGAHRPLSKAEVLSLYDAAGAEPNKRARRYDPDKARAATRRKRKSGSAQGATPKKKGATNKKGKSRQGKPRQKSKAPKS